jgi:type II secretory pathway pseudopilin PulG
MKILNIALLLYERSKMVLKRRQIKAMTLIEVLVAFVLLGFLSTMLATYGFQVFRLSDRTKKISQYVLEQSYFERRLSHLISEIDTSSLRDTNKKEQFNIFTSEGGRCLNCLFHPPIDPLNEVMNVQQFARLYVKDNKLYLERSPSLQLWDQEIQSKNRVTEILMEGVLSIDFEFLYTPLYEPGDEQPIVSEVLNSWLTSHLTIPSMVRINILRKDGRKDFAFYTKKTALVHYFL